MRSDHECWWTSRKQSEISDDGAGLSGAGVPEAVLRKTAVALRTMWSERPARDDEYGTEVAIGTVAKGSTHDGCRFRLEPASMNLKEALVRSVLRLHRGYVGGSLKQETALRAVLDQFATGTTIRLQSDPRRKRLTIRCYPVGGGVLARLRAKRVHVDCSNSREP